jgi:hypothetical protein
MTRGSERGGLATQLFAYLKPNTPFWEIFPNGQVPLFSPFPKPVNGNNCYLVNAQQLTESQILKFAALIVMLHREYHLKQLTSRTNRSSTTLSEMSMNEAIAYVKSCPLIPCHQFTTEKAQQPTTPLTKF